MGKEVQIAIEQFGRELSDLVHRVADGGDRVVFTRRGEPIAAIVPLNELDSLRGRDQGRRRSAWQKWLEESKRINQVILAETNGVPPDIDQLLKAARADLEEKGAGLSGDEK